MDILDNPFSVETPELMSAEEINDLFVPVGESYNIEVSSHVFLHGHRGSGKSMMFRRLSPDCQSLMLDKPVSKLNFFGVYVSIKKTDIDLSDYSMIENTAAQSIISEHMLVCFLMSKVFSSIEEYCELSPENNTSELGRYILGEFSDILHQSGYVGDFNNEVNESSSEADLVNHIVNKLDTLFNVHIHYLRKVRMGFSQHVDYDGPLLGFHDFFLPVVKKLKAFHFMPDGPIYLLIDDVDNLNLIQTKIINTWVSYRTTDIVSFKLATQMHYKTYLTISGRRIETPHDYKEVFYSNVYTGSKKEKYPQWIKEVTEKRLNAFYKKKYGYEKNIEVEDFFPFDIKQQKAIDEIANKYLTGEIPARGFRPADDAYRYARPDYIVSLGGAGKSSSTYKYAGFSQLIHISSGVIRYFLEPASTMFSLQERDSNGEMFLNIAPSIQNKVVREEADKLFFLHIDKIIDECENESSAVSGEKDTIHKLRSLIVSVGGVFYSAMKSEKSERRVFSFALSDPENISKDLNKVLKLGVEEGFFYESYVGTKEGIGRTKLYVLTRRLAPIFKLDPIGFSAYKFVTCDFLERSMMNSKKITNQLTRDGIDLVLNESSPSQEKLF